MKATESRDGVAMEMGTVGWVETPTAAILEIFYDAYMVVWKQKYIINDCKFWVELSSQKSNFHKRSKSITIMFDGGFKRLIKNKNIFIYENNGFVINIKYK